MGLGSPHPAPEARPVPPLGWRNRVSTPDARAGRVSPAGVRVRRVGEESYTFLTQAPRPALRVIEVLPAPSHWRPLVITRSGHPEPSLVSRRPSGGL